MQQIEALPETGVYEHEPRDQAERAGLTKRSLVCTLCGYGVFRSAPPERCPMCQAETAWIHSPTRLSTTLATA